MGYGGADGMRNKEEKKKACSKVTLLIATELVFPHKQTRATMSSGL